tara:strand:+ start:2146 stop:2763 length:618 start_codon:yes stop_codon:yes gene_type:complete
MSNKIGKLIVFSAPSGAGKSSLIKEIILQSSGAIQLSVSATTRLPRDGEVHGKDYFFISDREFDDLKKKDSFVEHANVYGHQYGTLKSFVDEKTIIGIDVILDIDVQGFDLIKDSIKNSISIFIIPPSLAELEKRLKLRGLDSNEVVEKRLMNAKTELKYAKLYDYIVLNDEFNKVLSELKSIIFDKTYESNKEINLNLLKDLLD